MTDGQYFVYGVGGVYVTLLTLFHYGKRWLRYREPDNYLKALRRMYHD